MRPLDRLDALLVVLAILVGLALVAGIDAAQSATPTDPSALCEETRPC